MIVSTGNVHEQVEQEDMSNTRFMALGHTLSEIMHEASNGRVKFTVEQYYRNNGQAVPPAQVAIIITKNIFIHFFLTC